MLCEQLEMKCYTTRNPMQPWHISFTLWFLYCKKKYIDVFEFYYVKSTVLQTNELNECMLTFRI